MKLQFKLFTVGAMILASLNTYSHGDREAFRGALEACSLETGVTRPQRGERPSDEDRTKMEACLAAKGIERPHFPLRDEKFKEAMKTCIAETGVPRPEKGRGPIEEDREKLKSCLEAKGMSLPSRRGGGGDAGSSSASAQ